MPLIQFVECIFVQAQLFRNIIGIINMPLRKIGGVEIYISP